MTELKLTKGFVAIVDDEDAATVSAFKWRVHVHRHGRGSTYAIRSVRMENGKWANQSLHRFLWDLWGMPWTPSIDHWDNDGLNNRRQNLRAATGTQNQGNRDMNRNNTSGYKGVVWNRGRRKWQASIGINGTVRHLGLFQDLKQAARAYDEAARSLFGAFAAVNFAEIPNERTCA